MKKPLYTNPTLQVKPSSIHGYGVFAGADINAGDIIEENYALLGDGVDAAYQDYYFAFPGTTKRALPLGNGCIYNHSSSPNARYYFNEEAQTAVFVAQRDIKAGEEIFITYGENWFSTRDLVECQTSLAYRCKKIMRKLQPLWRGALISGTLVGLILFLQ